MLAGERVLATVEGDCTSDPAGGYLTTVPCTNKSGGDAVRGTVDTATLPDGRYDLRYEAADPAGNTAAQHGSLSVDNTAPSAPEGAAVRGATPNTWSPTAALPLTWEVPAGQVAPVARAYVTVCEEAGACRSAETTQTGLAAERFAELVPADGRYVVLVSLADEAGNGEGFDAGRAARLSFWLDRTAPAAPRDLSVAGAVDAWQRPSAVSVAWKPPTDQMSRVASTHMRVCREGGGCTEERLGARTELGPEQLSRLMGSDGVYRLSISHGDAAGNGDAFDPARAAAATVRVDGTAPAAPAELTAVPSLSDPRQIALRWRATTAGGAPIAGHHIRVCDTAGSCQSTYSAGEGDIAQITLPGPGQWTVDVSLRDAAGNHDPASFARVGTRVAPAVVTKAVRPLTIERVRRDRSGTVLLLKVRTNRRMVARGTLTIRARRGGRSVTVSEAVALRAPRAGAHTLRCALSRSALRRLRGATRLTATLAIRGMRASSPIR